MSKSQDNWANEYAAWKMVNKQRFLLNVHIQEKKKASQDPGTLRTIL